MSDLEISWDHFFDLSLDSNAHFTVFVQEKHTVIRRLSNVRFFPSLWSNIMLNPRCYSCIKNVWINTTVLAGHLDGLFRKCLFFKRKKTADEQCIHFYEKRARLAFTTTIFLFMQLQVLFSLFNLVNVTFIWIMFQVTRKIIIWRVWIICESDLVNHWLDRYYTTVNFQNKDTFCFVFYCCWKVLKNYC